MVFLIHLMVSLQKIGLFCRSVDELQMKHEALQRFKCMSLLPDT